MKSVILASKSPRRKELLKKLEIKFKVIESKFDEGSISNLSPKILVKKLSLEKTKKVAKKYKNSIIIAADTIVVLNGKILGKPKDEKDAKKMLKSLSGRMHKVITGFTIIDNSSNKIISKSKETKVFMRKLTSSEIDSYIKTKEPFDKAGGYAIQEKGSVFIEKIEGDFFNAVGLPIFDLAQNLKNLGVNGII